MDSRTIIYEKTFLPSQFRLHDFITDVGDKDNTYSLMGRWKYNKIKFKEPIFKIYLSEQDLDYELEKNKKIEITFYDTEIDLIKTSSEFLNGIRLWAFQRSNYFFERDVFEKKLDYYYFMLDINDMEIGLWSNKLNIKIFE